MKWKLFRFILKDQELSPYLLEDNDKPKGVLSIQNCKASKTDEYNLETQKNITMPFLNGIIDACGIPKDKTKPLMIYEIKASKANDWKKLATLQSLLYGILSAKDYFKIHLMNVFSSKFI
jgi:hypothetical protein